ncbi:MAG: NAD-binding protein, partial [Pseudomonadota bacterium]
DEDERIFDMPVDEDHDIIIAGYGRVGQIIGRLLSVAGVPFTALDRDSSQVDVVRRYGATVHFGDAKRHDLLHAAGARRAHIFVLAISNIEESVRIAESVIHNYPHLTIIARARNRRHVHSLMDLGIKHIFRETLSASLAMSELVLTEFGQTADEAHRTVEAFAEHDNELLIEEHQFYDSEEKLIQTIKDASVELEALLRGDRSD